MNSFFKIPWFFFSVATLIGLVLRWHLNVPIDDFNYQYVLHAHSHLMFLGWVMNFLMLAYIHQFLLDQWKDRYRTLFILMQVLLIGMAISFPLQGYGLYSITFTTLHTVILFVFIIRFFRDTKIISEQQAPSIWFVRASLIFFIVSAIGPFVVGFLSAMGYSQSKWYFFSIYYYLHFQYNGVFTFGLLGLFFKLLEGRQIQYSFQETLRFGKLMAIACVFAYFLSVLWAKPGLVFNAIGFVAAAAQLIGFWLLTKILFSITKNDAEKISRFAKFIFILVFIFFGMKLLLQLISSIQYFASLAYIFRAFVIAYLHWMLIGVVSIFIIGWYVEMGLMKNAKRPFFILLFSFIGMEVLLVIRPFYDVGMLILVMSVLIGIGVLQCTSRVVTTLRDNSF